MQLNTILIHTQKSDNILKVINLSCSLIVLRFFLQSNDLQLTLLIAQSDKDQQKT